MNAHQPSPALTKRRLDEFLWHSSSVRAATLRAHLRDLFGEFDDLAIVGGMARDFSRTGARGFKSDVDVVINAPTKAIADLASRIGATQNRFGGYGVSLQLWKIDFWALETTWAHTHDHVRVRCTKDIVDTTFFNTDAILYDLSCRKIYYKENYFDDLYTNRIEINLKPNPSPLGNLLRAVRRIIHWHSEPGEQLTEFVSDQIGHYRLDEMKHVEFHAFGNSVLSQYEDSDQVMDTVWQIKTGTKDHSYLRQRCFAEYYDGFYKTQETKSLNNKQLLLF